MKPIHVFVIADSIIVKTGITTLLAQASDIEVLDSTATVSYLVGLPDGSPDVMLICLSATQSQVNSSIITALKQRYPLTAVLLLCSEDAFGYLTTYVSSGVNGFLPQDLEPMLLLQSIRDVSRYGLIVHKKILPALLQKLDAEVRYSTSSGLTERELQIVRLTAKGYTNPEIALELCVSVNTVKTHLRKIYEKVAVSNRVELAAVAPSFENRLSESSPRYLVQTDSTEWPRWVTLIG
ncbi:MAG: response regulator transcription factor [Caldilineaceae bacterium]|nr:response regulator transcription factor [Caldilineaceae bacterium]